MKLRAQITIDMEAQDYVDAADHQRKVQNFLNQLQTEYAQAHLLFRERRTREAMGEPLSRPPVRRPSGRVNAYEEG